jgi:Domain of unknown function (DUF3291)
MVFVSVTRLRVRSVFYLPQFVWYAIQSQRQAQRAPGLIAGQVARDVRNAFWTTTMWESERAMEVFRVQGAHRGAMPKLLDWCDEASLVHWTQKFTELPTWQEAYERLIKNGRPSKVRHPSAAHLAHQFPAPRPGLRTKPFRPPAGRTV